MNDGVGPIVIRQSVTEICEFAEEFRLLFQFPKGIELKLWHYHSS